MAYSDTSTLLLGNIPLPAGDRAEKAVENAAREMDSMIGLRYVVPVTPSGPQEHTVKSLLFTINNWLATGRLIEELTASSQTVEIHAYANNLIQQALSTLRSIMLGEIILIGCLTVGEDGSGTVNATGPVVANADPSSPTNYYYNEIDNPLVTVQNRDLMNRLTPTIYGYIDGGG